MLSAMICLWMTGGYPTICIIMGVTHRLLGRHKQIHMAFWAIWIWATTANGYTHRLDFVADIGGISH